MNFGTAQLVQEMLRGPKPAAVPPAAQPNVSVGGVIPSGMIPNMPGDWMRQMSDLAQSRLRGEPQPVTSVANVVTPVVEDPAAMQQPMPAAAPRQAAPSPYIDPSQVPQLAASAATQAATPRATQQSVAQQIYPERFGTNDDRRIDEIQGRVSVDSRAQKMMRMAQMNGQTLPFALAYQMASNAFPTTSAQTTGMPSLPPLDPARMAGLGPQAGGVAGQTAIGMGMNENTAGRNQMDFYNEQGRQGLARDGRQDQNQIMLMELMRRLTADQHTQRNENRVLDNTLGNPQRQERQDAEAWMSSPAGMAMRTSLDPQERQFYQTRMQRAMGSNPVQGATPEAGAAPVTQEALRKQREASLVADPVAMQQHLAQFPDALARQREEARLYYENGRANEPSIFNFLKTILEQEDPNLHAGPDWMTTDNNRAAAAAKWANQGYGVPEDVAKQHYYRYFDN
jgi:hypothetical protein